MLKPYYQFFVTTFNYFNFIFFLANLSVKANSLNLKKHIIIIHILINYYSYVYILPQEKI